jgi:hypothetical protein
MATTDQLYATQMKQETTRFANWPPNAPIGIGTYGTINGALFEPEEQITGLTTITSDAPASMDFTIHANRTLNTSAQALVDAGVSSGKALLEVSFQDEAGVTFSAPETWTIRVASFKELGDILLARNQAGDWNKDHSVIYEIIRATKATIIVSKSSNASIKFAVAADTPINPTVMANLDVNSSIAVEKGVGAKIIGEGPIYPLFRLLFLKSHFFGDPTIEKRRGAIAGEEDKIHPLTDDYYLELF